MRPLSLEAADAMHRKIDSRTAPRSQLKSARLLGSSSPYEVVIPLEVRSARLERRKARASSVHVAILCFFCDVVDEGRVHYNERRLIGNLSNRKQERV